MSQGTYCKDVGFHQDARSLKVQSVYIIAINSATVLITLVTCCEAMQRTLVNVKAYSVGSGPSRSSQSSKWLLYLAWQVGQGAGYMYMHQGCCEHLLELKDVRSVQLADTKLAAAFPCTMFQVCMHFVLMLSIG